MLPLLAARAGFNPALTSAPLMTTIIDSSGLLIYFFVAQLYLGSVGHVVDRHHAHGHHDPHAHEAAAHAAGVAAAAAAAPVPVH